MQIDWFTLIAQIVNFLILLFLLKHFLYNRIINVMNERQNRIKNQLQEAHETREKADQELEEYKQKNLEIDQKRENVLADARDKADEERKKLIKQARNHVDELRQKWQNSVMQEKEDFFQELQQKTGKQVFNVAKILMKELADEDLQEKMAQSFVKKIDNLSKKDRQKIREQAEETDYSMHVSSRFDLSDDSKSRIEKSLRDKISSKIKLNFDSTDEFVCGINLQIDGHKVVWTVDEYLQNLEDEFEEELKNRFESTKKANENE